MHGITCRLSVDMICERVLVMLQPGSANVSIGRRRGMAFLPLRSSRRSRHEHRPGKCETFWGDGHLLSAVDRVMPAQNNGLDTTEAVAPRAYARMPFVVIPVIRNEEYLLMASA
jgi:hypothetical protein